MSIPTTGAIRRPTFYEGQVVGAADLNGVIESARAGMAQHERYLHIWGIAEGLALSGTDQTTVGGDAYVEVSLSAGLAVDGTGRHLAVVNSIRLSEDTFDQLNVAINDPEAYYPVFLTGRDEVPPVSDAPLTACQSSATSHVLETAEVTFGRVDRAADPGNDPVTDVSAGPGGSGAGTGDPWLVLVGFVKWDSSIKRFTAVANSHNGVGRQYAGVRADEVVARGGKLAVRTAAKGENGTPVMELDRATDGEMRFGLQNSSGNVVPVFSVNGKGDLTVTGKITGAISGGAQIQTGSTFDGALLSLPPGIEQAQVDRGEVLVQAHVTPRYGVAALPPPATAGEQWLMTPIECRVEDRRVYCRVRWAVTGGPEPPLVLPGVCDYTLMAFSTKS
ncbi:MAG: hypothetical protein QNJ40_06090 [Xanthomonadales bacterium]|nr:hypothetical protein [Xanthomonadales bacterium]